MNKLYPEELANILEKTGIDEEEIKLWKVAADKMYYRINKKYGIYEQDVIEANGMLKNSIMIKAGQFKNELMVS